VVGQLFPSSARASSLELYYRQRRRLGFDGLADFAIPLSTVIDRRGHGLGNVPAPATS
jgi:hypothetical protein